MSEAMAPALEFASVGAKVRHTLYMSRVLLRSLQSNHYAHLSVRRKNHERVTKPIQVRI